MFLLQSLLVFNTFIFLSLKAQEIERYVKSEELNAIIILLNGMSEIEQ